MQKVFFALSLIASIAAYQGTAFADDEVKSVAYFDYQQSIATRPDRFKADLCGAYYDHSYARLFSCLNARPGYAESYVGPALAYTFAKSYPGDETGEIQIGAGFGPDSRSELSTKTEMAWVRGRASSSPSILRISGSRRSTTSTGRK